MNTFAITGWIRLSSPQSFEDAVAIVGLDDVTRLDVPSLRVAEAFIDHVNGVMDRISFRLTLPGCLSKFASYVLSAEIRRSGGSSLRSGDFLTVAAHPWTHGRLDGNVIDVNQI
jgi:uncharacterized lipoprotein YbaY